MKKYGLRKDLKIILPILILVLFAAATFGICYFCKGGIKNTAIFICLIVVFYIVPLLLTAIYVCNLACYIVFDVDYFEYHFYGKVKRVYSKDVRYYGYNKGTFEIIYETEHDDITDDLIDEESEENSEKEFEEDHDEDSEKVSDEENKFPGDNEIKYINDEAVENICSFSIQNFWLYEKGDKILEWFNENVEYSYNMQQWSEISEINENFRNLDNQKINEAYQKAKKSALWVNIIGVVVGLWIMFFPKATFYSLMMGIIYPWICIFVLYFSRGIIKIDTNEKSMYPSVGFGLIAPGFFLCLRMVYNVGVYDYITTLIYAGIYFIIPILFLIIYQFKYNLYSKQIVSVILPVAVFLLFYAFGSVMAVNVVFDNTPGVESETKIEKKVKKVYKHPGVLGIEWFYFPKESKAK